MLLESTTPITVHNALPVPATNVFHQRNSSAQTRRMHLLTAVYWPAAAEGVA